jgi:RNA polymerase sigma-70 factor (ECF subfamily)
MPSNAGQPPATVCQEDEEILAAVRALQAGAGPDAFTPIALRFWKPVHRFFVKRPALREQADDLAQATIWRAYERIGQYHFDAPFYAWLRRIAENVWKNAVRDQMAAKRSAPVEPLDAAGQEREGLPAAARVANAEPTPEELALARERERVLRDAIEALPQGMKLCAKLRLYSDLEYREIAEVTGIGINSVRSQLFEARKRLQPVLEQYFQGTEL